MDIGSILLILAVLIPVVIFIAHPLHERKSTAVTIEEHDYSALLAERDRILNALQELEFDYTLGKIPEDLYPAQRANLMRSGVEILRKIDEYEGSSAESTADDRLEAAIAFRKAAQATEVLPAVAPVVDPDDELEARIAARLRAQKESNQPKTGGFCPHCGNCVHESDRFCPKCGKPLA